MHGVSRQRAAGHGADSCTRRRARPPQAAATGPSARSKWGIAHARMLHPTLGAVIDIETLVRSAGGAIRTCELNAVGMDRWELERLVEAGRLWRVRRGWFVLPGTARSVLGAVRVGGALTCGEALAAAGIWSLHDPRTHVRVVRTASRLRTAHDARKRLSETLDPRTVVHWTATGPHAPRLIAAPAQALDDYFACVERDVALASLDSFLRKEPARASTFLRRFGVSLREGVDGGCESGVETIFFVRMLRLGLIPRRQVSISGVGRVDFLFGARLVVEIDGREFHDLAEVFERDRARDTALSTSGFRTLRFSFRQVIHCWADVEKAVLAAIARGDHL